MDRDGGVIKVLLLAPIEKPGLTGGQARAGSIVSFGLRKRIDVALVHSVQAHRQEARGIFDLVRLRFGQYVSFLKNLVFEKPDVVHIFSTCSIQAVVEKSLLALVARIFGVPTIINLRNDPVLALGQLSTSGQWVYRHSLRAHRGAICQYEALRDFYIGDLGFHSGHVFTVHNAAVGLAIDISEDMVYRRFEKRRIVFLGSLQRRKGLDALFHAAALLKESEPVWIDVVGDAQPAGYVEELRELASDLGVLELITFHGPLFGVKKEDVLCDAGVLVLPSRAEGFPNVVLEAGSLKIPVILTRVGAAADIAAAFGLGALCVDVDDVKGLSQAIVEIYDNARQYSHRAGCAAHGASMFNVQRMGGRLVTAYAAISGRGCAEN